MKKGSIEDLIQHMQKPKIFAKSTAPFWDDPHISKHLLQAHLDPQSDLASRKHETIDEAVNWIIRKSALQKGDHILDLGCGPGLYCARFAQKGMMVTGLDYSKRSIQYAQEYAAEHKLNIEYIYKDYLTIHYRDAFDIVTLIYYDLGVLSDEDRDLLLGKIYKSIKPGGYFVFDVNTPKYHESIDEQRTWTYEEKGFWRPIPYVVLTHTIKYPEHDVLLTRYFVLDSNSNIEIYHIWDHAYTQRSISHVLSNAGFQVIGFYDNIAESRYSGNSKTMAIIARKSP